MHTAQHWIAKNKIKRFRFHVLYGELSIGMATFSSRGVQRKCKSEKTPTKAHKNMLKNFFHMLACYHIGIGLIWFGLASMQFHYPLPDGFVYHKMMWCAYAFRNRHETTKYTKHTDTTKPSTELWRENNKIKLLISPFGSLTLTIGHFKQS